MITSKEAHTLARKEIGSLLLSRDDLFLPWEDGELVTPIIVSNVFGRPSYWLVPLEVGGRAVGFVRISATGAVLAAGVFCRDPRQISKCPQVGTGISRNEALQRASEKIDASVESADQPMFVHDGPIGREAWLVQVRRFARPQRWLFVTSAGIYERPAGEILDNGLEA